MPRVGRGTRRNKTHKPAALPKRYTPGFLAKLDRRTEIAKALEGVFDAVVSDLGGAEGLSQVQLGLVEQWVFLYGTLGGMQNELATLRSSNADPEAARKREAELFGRVTQSVNTLVGLSRLLGLERKTPTIDLKGYLETKGNGDDA